MSVIVGSIADGDTIDAVLAAYPHLSTEDIRAALKFAAEAGLRRKAPAPSKAPAKFFLKI